MIDSLLTLLGILASVGIAGIILIIIGFIIVFGIVLSIILTTYKQIKEIDRQLFRGW